MFVIIQTKTDYVASFYCIPDVLQWGKKVFEQSLVEQVLPF